MFTLRLASQSAKFIKLSYYQSYYFSAESHYQQFTQQSQQNTLYDILGIQKSATQDQVKSAYIHLAKQYHPDVSKNKDSEDLFKDIQKAYEILKDPAKRKLYDFNLNAGSTQQNEQFYQQYERASSKKPDQDSNGQENSQYYKDNSGYRYTSNFWDFKENYNTARRSSEYKDFYNSKNNDHQSQSQYKYKSKENFWIRMKIHWVAAVIALVYLDRLWDIYHEQDIQLEYERRKKEKDIMDTELRRQNVIMSKQTIDDPPYIQEKRRQELQKEMINKKFRIEVDYLEDSKPSKLKSKKQENERKQQQMTLESFSKRILKSDSQKPVRPDNINLTIEQYQEYM